MYIANTRFGTKIGQSFPTGKRNMQTKFTDAHDNICQRLVKNSNDLSHKLEKKFRKPACTLHQRTQTTLSKIRFCELIMLKHVGIVMSYLSRCVLLHHRYT